MKNLPILTLAATAFATATFGQHSQVETRDGVRHVVAQSNDALNEDGQLLQSRAIKMGYFTWPVSSEAVTIPSENRPKAVSDCEGHDPDYRPAHDFTSGEDREMRTIGQGRAFLYEFAAYRNAISAGDCGCDSLRADWDTAFTDFNGMIIGVERVGAYTHVAVRVRNLIKNDYNDMCDVTMSLDLK